MVKLLFFSSTLSVVCLEIVYLSLFLYNELPCVYLPGSSGCCHFLEAILVSNASYASIQFFWEIKSDQEPTSPNIFHDEAQYSDLLLLSAGAVKEWVGQTRGGLHGNLGSVAHLFKWAVRLCHRIKKNHAPCFYLKTFFLEK